MDFAGRFFHANNVLYFGQSSDRFRQHIARSSTRYVVQYLRNLHSVCNGFVVQKKAFLSRFIIVRSDQQARLGTRLLRAFGQSNRFARSIRAGARYYRDSPADVCDDPL